MNFQNLQNENENENNSQNKIYGHKNEMNFVLILSDFSESQ